MYHVVVVFAVVVFVVIVVVVVVVVVVVKATRIRAVKSRGWALSAAPVPYPRSLSRDLRLRPPTLGRRRRGEG